MDVNCPSCPPDPLEARAHCALGRFYHLMEDGNLLYVTSWICLLSSLACQLVGIQICSKIIRKGGASDISVVPFFAFFVSACWWLRYGIMQNLHTVILTSLIGAVLQFIYITIYYIYTLKKNTACQNVQQTTDDIWKYSTKVCADSVIQPPESSINSHIHRLASVTILLLFTPLVYIRFYMVDPAIASGQLGTLCSFATVACYASPLATLTTVMRTKSCDSMSFPLCLMNFVAAVCWVIYGSMIDNSYVSVSNSTGVMLGIMQFGLFCAYPSSASKTVSTSHTVSI